MTVTQDDSSLILRVAEALFDYDQLDFAFDDIPEVREKFIQRAQVAWSLMAIDFFEGSQVLAEQSFAKHREDAEHPLLERIEALEAWVKRLRKALQPFARASSSEPFLSIRVKSSDVKRARQALGETQ